MKQQLEQLLKDAEEVTAKMREALANMDKPAIKMEHGKWYRVKTSCDWLIKFDRIEDGKMYDLYCFRIDIKKVGDSAFGISIENIQSYSTATPEDMQLLPDGHPEKPKPALAATYNEIVDVVKPEWVIGCKSPDAWKTSPDPYQLPTEQAANQHRAYIQIKNLEAYCAVKFEGGRDYSVIYVCNRLRVNHTDYDYIKVTKEAAEWLIANHPEPFLVFFGVKS